MQRQVLDNGQWFDISASTSFGEDTWWDGSNNISRATGSQWEHQTLYRTKGKQWILHSWSQWENARDAWEKIDSREAALWLSKNNKEPHEACQKEYAELEVA